MLASHAREQEFIPPGSAPDPRIYAEPSSPASISEMLLALGASREYIPEPEPSDQWPRPVAAKRIPKARVERFANFMAAQSNEKEKDYTWRRDVADWLHKKRAISPDKLRRLSETLDESWIEAFCTVGYYQHVVLALGFLLEARHYREVAIVSAFVFPNWDTIRWSTSSDGIAVLDLFDHLRPALREVEKTLQKLSIWEVIPARVAVDEIREEAIRCVFRLCDPAEADLMRDGLLHYPSATAKNASAHILRDAVKAKLRRDPFDIESLLIIVCGKKRAAELGSKRGSANYHSPRKVKK